MTPLAAGVLRLPGRALAGYLWDIGSEPATTLGLLRAADERVAAGIRSLLRWFGGDPEASWVELPGMARVSMREHETDLIASHVLATG